MLAGVPRLRCCRLPRGHSSAERAGQDHGQHPAEIAAPLARAVCAQRSHPHFWTPAKAPRIGRASLPLLAVQVAWARDPLLRATTPPVMDASEGERVETASLAQAFEAAFPSQYSELSRNKTARNAASSWTQSGHLAGRAKKTRQRIKPTAVAVTMAFFLGNIAGYHGAAVFSNPWCRAPRSECRPCQGHGLGGPSGRDCSTCVRWVKSLN